MLQLGGHAFHKTSAGYQRPDQQNADWIIAAKHGTPSKIWADLEASYQTKKKKKNHYQEEDLDVNHYYQEEEDLNNNR